MRGVSTEPRNGSREDALPDNILTELIDSCDFRRILNLGVTS